MWNEQLLGYFRFNQPLRGGLGENSVNFLIIKEHNPQVVQAWSEKTHSWLHLQVGYPQAIKLPPKLSHGHFSKWQRDLIMGPGIDVTSEY